MKKQLINLIPWLLLGLLAFYAYRGQQEKERLRTQLNADQQLVDSYRDLIDQLDSIHHLNQHQNDSLQKEYDSLMDDKLHLSADSLERLWTDRFSDPQ